LYRRSRAAARDRRYNVTVEDFEPDADVHAIVRQAGKLRNTAVHLNATDHFDEEMPLSNVDLLVCWELGDPTELREYERSGYIGGDVEVDLDGGAITYEKESSNFVRVLEVKELLTEERAAVADD